PRTAAGWWSRTVPPPSLDRYNRTSFALDEPAASPSTGTPDGHLHPWGNAARSGQSTPSTAPPDPSRSGTALCGSACACRRTRHRRRSSASSEDSVGGRSAILPKSESLFQTVLNREIKAMATSESWRVVCQDPGDGSGDVIVELPPALLEKLGWALGD